MKRVLVDTNVLLDVLLERAPHAVHSVELWKLVERGQVDGVIAGHAVTTIYYLVERDRGADAARRAVGIVLRVFQVAPVNESVLNEGLTLTSPDFEDAVTSAAARSDQCDAIVTRDPKGFRGSLVAVYTPQAILPLLAPKAN